MDADLKSRLTPKLTGWYDRGQRPARPGIYQRLMPQGGYTYSYYGDGQWLRGLLTPELANETRKPSFWQRLPWRGLDREVTL